MSLTTNEMKQLQELRDKLLNDFGKESLLLPVQLVIDAAEQSNLTLLQAYETMIPQGYINEDIKSAVRVTQRMEYAGALTTNQLDIVVGVEGALSHHVTYLFDEDETPLEEYDPIFKTVLDNAEHSTQLLKLIKERRILDAQSLEQYLPEIKNQHAATFEGIL